MLNLIQHLLYTLFRNINCFKRVAPPGLVTTFIFDCYHKAAPTELIDLLDEDIHPRLPELVSGSHGLDKFYHKERQEKYAQRNAEVLILQQLWKSIKRNARTTPFKTEALCSTSSSACHRY